MDDDTKLVDTSIRPVLPSRQNADTPRFDLAAQVEKLGVDSLLPPKPARTRKEKPVKKPKDKKRSTIAKAAWQTRRKNATKPDGVNPMVTVEVARVLSALLGLRAEHRKFVIELVQVLRP